MFFKGKNLSNALLIMNLKKMNPILRKNLLLTLKTFTSAELTLISQRSSNKTLFLCRENFKMQYHFRKVIFPKTLYSA